MILTILSIVWFPVTIITFKHVYKISDDFDSKLGLSIFSMVMSFVIVLVVLATIFINRTPQGIAKTKAELHSRYEILNEVKDNPYAYDEIMKYNYQVELYTHRLENPLCNWFYCPAYKEAKIIELD